MHGYCSAGLIRCTSEVQCMDIVVRARLDAHQRYSAWICSAGPIRCTSEVQCMDIVVRARLDAHQRYSAWIL